MTRHEEILELTAAVRAQLAALDEKLKGPPACRIPTGTEAFEKWWKATVTLSTPPLAPIPKPDARELFKAGYAAAVANLKGALV